MGLESTSIAQLVFDQYDRIVGLRKRGPGAGRIHKLPELIDLGGTCMLFGDSIPEGGFTGPATVIAGAASLTAKNYFAIGCALAGGPFDRFVDASTSGKTTRQLIDGDAGGTWNSLDTNLKNIRPRHVANGPLSVNNLGVISADDTIAQARAIWDAQLAFETVESISICTVHTTGAANLKLVSAKTNREWYRAVNAAVRAYRDENPDRVFLIEMAKSLDASDRSGPKAGLTNDNTHPNNAGGAKVGFEEVYPVIASKRSTNAWRISTNALDPKNLIGPSAAFSTSAAIGAAGSGTGVVNTGCSGNLPKGVGARQAIGEAAGATVVCSVITAPKGRGEKSAKAVITPATAGGGGWMRFGDNVDATYCGFDAARASSRLYSQNERYSINATLFAVLHTEGTTAASAPDFTGLVEGDVFADGTATLMVQTKPLITDTIRVSVDMSVPSAAGQGEPVIILNVVDTAGTAVANMYPFFSGAVGNTADSPWPSGRTWDRALHRQSFDLSKITTLVGGIRHLGVRVGWSGEVGQPAEVQVHAVETNVVVPA